MCRLAGKAAATVRCCWLSLLAHCSSAGAASSALAGRRKQPLVPARLGPTSGGVRPRGLRLRDALDREKDQPEKYGSVDEAVNTRERLPKSHYGEDDQDHGFEVSEQSKKSEREDLARSKVGEEPSGAEDPEHQQADRKIGMNLKQCGDVGRQRGKDARAGQQQEEVEEDRPQCVEPCSTQDKVDRKADGDREVDHPIPPAITTAAATPRPAATSARTARDFCFEA